MRSSPTRDSAGNSAVAGLMSSSTCQIGSVPGSAGASAGCGSAVVVRSDISGDHPLRRGDLAHPLEREAAVEAEQEQPDLHGEGIVEIEVEHRRQRVAQRGVLILPGLME